MANPRNRISVDEIRALLASDRKEAWGPALCQLLNRVREDPTLHPMALPVFREWARRAPDGYAAVNAMRGIEVILGPGEARSGWIALMQHPNESVACAAIMLAEDPSLVPVLIRLYPQRPRWQIRAVILRALGRLKDPAALPVLVQALAAPDLVGDALRALGDLGDPRAIPNLLPLLHDPTLLPPEDNHAPSNRVSDLARSVIATLEGMQHTSPGSVHSIRDRRADPGVFPAARRLTRTLPARWLAWAPLLGVVLSGVTLVLLVLYVLNDRGRSNLDTMRLARLPGLPALLGLLAGIPAMTEFPQLGTFQRAALLLGVGLSLLISMACLLPH